MENFFPCENIYKDERAYATEPDPLGIKHNKYMSMEDVFMYPVIDLHPGWSLYLNRLTINEARKYFAFRTDIAGKMMIRNYERERRSYPGKNDLSWVDYSADWNIPLN